MTTIIMNPELFGAPDCDNQVTAFAKWVKASPMLKMPDPVARGVGGEYS